MNPNEFDTHIKTMFPPESADFDFMGFLYREPKDIYRMGIGLGLNEMMIVKAHKLKCDILLVHNAPENLNELKYYKKIKQMLKAYRISLYRVHLPLDFAPQGLIAKLCNILGFTSAYPTTLQYQGHKIVGGVYEIKESITMNDLLVRIKRLHPQTVRIAGSSRRIYKKIAITTGDGCKPEFLDQLRPDVFVCGLLNQESERVARDMGITIIEATSHATENEPLKHIYTELRKQLPLVEALFIDLGDTISSFDLNDKKHSKEVL
jgi:putative NIF3 family GTP cyclohydrolase 1 type 2